MDVSRNVTQEVVNYKSGAEIPAPAAESTFELADLVRTAVIPMLICVTASPQTLNRRY